MPLPTVPLSAIPGVAWPAIPSPEAAGLLSILFQLESTQWLGADRIQELQLGQLRSLVAHALETVPYYRELPGVADFPADDAFDLDTWREFPVLTRDALMRNRTALVSESVPAPHQPLAPLRSSGSTGKPVESDTTAVTRTLWNAFALRDHYWHGRDLRLPFAAIRYAGKDAQYPQGDSMPNWGPPTTLVHPSGPSSLLNIKTPVTRQIEWIRRKRPAYLLTYPSNILEVARKCIRDGIEFEGLREIRLFGEVVDETVRAACREAWRVPATDGYSANEVGYVALQCPEHEHYHVQAEGCLVEVIDDSGRPCTPGEIGRILITPLHNFGMPLLRYAVGDYAEVGHPCPCGRGLPVLTRILGRTRNLLVFPNGARIWPSFGLGSYAGMEHVRQHQLIQHSRRHIEVKLVTERPLTEEEQETLRRQVLRALAHPFEITFSFHDELLRSAGGKYEEFISKVV